MTIGRLSVLVNVGHGLRTQLWCVQQYTFIFQNVRIQMPIWKVVVVTEVSWFFAVAPKDVGILH
jgi:hypothetical protein